MDEHVASLKQVLGDVLYDDIAILDSEHVVNKREIYCDCKTLILRPKHAKLILPDEQTLKIQEELKHCQPKDRLFKNLLPGCFWLVDDMYKFEQMGFSKEISAQNIREERDSSTLSGLRYLACAECNQSPLGWSDPKTKYSYLYVWTDNQH